MREPRRTVNVFESLESDVRSYCRSWPAVFDRAVGSELFDTSGRAYVDFFAGHTTPKWPEVGIRTAGIKGL